MLWSYIPWNLYRTVKIVKNIPLEKGFFESAFFLRAVAELQKRETLQPEKIMFMILSRRLCGTIWS